MGDIGDSLSTIRILVKSVHLVLSAQCKVSRSSKDANNTFGVNRRPFEAVGIESWPYLVRSEKKRCRGSMIQVVHQDVEAVPA